MRIYKAPVITRIAPQQTQPPAVVNRGQFINHCVKISNSKGNTPFNIREKSPQLTQKSESSGLRLLDKKQLAPPVKAYIYAPFFSKDTVLHAIELNVSRVLQGKEPYPILSANPEKLIKTGLKNYTDENKKTLANGAEYQRRFSEVLNKVSIEDAFKSSPLKLKRLGEYLALKNTPIISLDKANPTLLEKIYIVGHGRAGSNLIYSGEHGPDSFKSTDMLANEIKGLISQVPGHKIDVRMMQCHSADRETVSKMDSAVLNQAAMSLNGIKPLAQYMSDSLHKNGIDTTTYGYPGMGVSRSHRHLHHVRALKSEFVTHKDKSLLYRASEFRRAFTSETKQTSPIKLENPKTSVAGSYTAAKIPSVDVESTDL
ncbi:hypothetical protein [Yersinia aldovae]|uniref:hypothetical protein n=1 Tax=Yersinia aldovae TaxID=29483 RepID=UPI0011A90636|nr:hypothetical protein [Yersinia aldovae]